MLSLIVNDCVFFFIAINVYGFYQFSNLYDLLSFWLDVLPPIELYLICELLFNLNLQHELVLNALQEKSPRPHENRSFPSRPQNRSFPRSVPKELKCRCCGEELKPHEAFCPDSCAHIFHKKCLAQRTRGKTLKNCPHRKCKKRFHKMEPLTPPAQ